ncbi:hypothetical protein SESBI_51215 [Sesbania bispinosa]|nr:hypothetical protein SESBI_51215 [Sesbania bispinosa]
MAANGNWKLDNLQGGLPTDIILKINAVPPLRDSLEEDTPIWADASDGNFQMKLIYAKLGAQYDSDIDPKICHHVWKWKVDARSMMNLYYMP